MRDWGKFLFAVGGALLATCSLTLAQSPIPPNMFPCNGTVGTGAQQITFPAAGYSGAQTPPITPTVYLLIQNTSNNDEWINPLPGGVATLAPPSYNLLPTAAFFWTSTDPIPAAVSIIASAAGSTYSCWYK